MSSIISCTVSESLSGKLIVIAVTGSIAAVRTVDLVRDLIRRGGAVHSVMSSAAQEIIHPYALEYASGNPVVTKITGRVEHVEFCGVGGRADLLLIAPATANSISKIASGIDDTPVTTYATTALGSGVPVMVVPAMHEAMYRHPAVLKNLDALRSMGVVVVDPRIEEEKAKIAENRTVVMEVERLLGPADLAGRRILVTSGATAERVDPIRILTNRASGKTGTEIALEAWRRGAEVTLVHRGHLGLPVKEIYIESAGDMLSAVLAELEEGGYDAMIAAAAVSDYTLDASAEKIKSEGELVLRLKTTTKIIRNVRSLHPELKMVGFKAETFLSDDDLLSRAKESMEKNRLDIVVANDVGKGGIGTEENRVLILRRSGARSEVCGRKSLIARAVIDALAEEFS
ncbi:MAG: bifunctional phosphopantothenoylcysteine decarboxylase/phosphopantothenate--cysteine ligase CoaBC [Methanothrix sp.]|jgi:phosphopantothenoylcysteine decarboxylase/phosphopantothenate--cysteine ligase|uniref:Coenzyme A biosynthesis bifunctional protein CoaBC n=1 Tax=Methanothrix harundinacea TaxID=301375 RepID=A0A101ILC3_9EURY|nr:MAG: DNA/pantothenate metabolism flavoprotein [Methanosaeta sp. SDB]KUK43761.1 MAG: Phosphopantothenoylcysteine decarboxylase/phosphopantothenate--cysteine ligase [Methanothrix harundinacea]MDD3709962.1 bifunctional phosphopantothenoylcysteine decarboxylase/phosphopantothenate--cysteine ligase CoaBC [Methanothrix sp.]MDI9400045.1 bifunctional phosphopantothenoylcysteine decarboxylase/phosphopantothenate--cysteine ligase CoaBC [Euryarchaeota archaeon]KUK97336.1 MAG: Phosphopantothenoylcystein